MHKMTPVDVNYISLNIVTILNYNFRIYESDLTCVRQLFVYSNNRNPLMNHLLLYL